MRLRFESLFRGYLVLLLGLLVWSLWASAQDVAPAESSVEAASAAVEPVSDPLTPWLTFGLDQVDWLQRRVMDIPLYQYCASFIYVFLALYVSKLIDVLVRGGSAAGWNDHPANSRRCWWDSCADRFAW